jgi:hypothetical protein
MKQKIKRKRSFKVGDIVLVRSPAGKAIPDIHVRLVEKVVVNPTKGKYVGIRKTMDWPGYTGWEAEIVYQSEADMLRKEWSIPYEGPGDSLFVYENNIIKRVLKLKQNNVKTNSDACSKNKKKGRRRIVRTRSSDG